MGEVRNGSKRGSMRIAVNTCSESKKILPPDQIPKKEQKMRITLVCTAMACVLAVGLLLSPATATAPTRTGFRYRMGSARACSSEGGCLWLRKRRSA